MIDKIHRLWGIMAYGKWWPQSAWSSVFLRRPTERGWSSTSLRVGCGCFCRREQEEYLSCTSGLECFHLCLDTRPSLHTLQASMFRFWWWYQSRRFISSPRRFPCSWFWFWRDGSWLFQLWYLSSDRKICYTQSQCAGSPRFPPPSSLAPLQSFSTLTHQEGERQNQFPWRY